MYLLIYGADGLNRRDVQSGSPISAQLPHLAVTVHHFFAFTILKAGQRQLSFLRFGCGNFW
jgi:hypothetical protein